MTTKTSYRLALAVAVATVLFLIWAIGALGINGLYVALFGLSAWLFARSEGEPSAILDPVSAE